MARCEKGYLCVVCGQEVEVLSQSALYLRYLLGEIAPEELHRVPECHLNCDPGLAQYIAAAEFPACVCEGPFDKRTLDPAFVAAEETRVTSAWQRLQEAANQGGTVLGQPGSALN